MASKQEHQLDSRSLLPFRLAVSSGSYGGPASQSIGPAIRETEHNGSRAKPTGKRENRRTMTANGEPEIHEFRGVSSCWNNGNLSASARVFPVGLGRERLSWCTCLINSSPLLPPSSYNSGGSRLVLGCAAKQPSRTEEVPMLPQNRVIGAKLRPKLSLIDERKKEYRLRRESDGERI